MKKRKLIVYTGTGMQALVIILMLILVLFGKPIPDYVSNMFYVGLFLIMLGSLLSVRKEEPEPKDKRKLITLLVILIILTVTMTMTMFSLS